MKLSYFDLLSPAPIKLIGVGHITSPTLRDIAAIGYDTYQYYLTILSMDLKNYLKITGMFEQYESLPDKEKEQINIFNILLSNEDTRNSLVEILNFFIKESVSYSVQDNCFLIRRDSDNVGIITQENYYQVCDVICRCSCIKSGDNEDLSKIKSKKALEIFKKIKKGREQKAKQTKADKNMELGNIISAVSNKSQSINIINIWDLTVFQLWDCFSRISNNSIYDIQSMSVATWGDKDNSFDASAWFKKIETED